MLPGFRTAVCSLAVFMVIWVLVLPATWMNGTFRGHADWLARLIPLDNMPAPSDIISKWGPHATVRFTHTLPSAGWAACAAFQIWGPGVSARARLLHRFSGRFLLICSVLITLGYLAIERGGLSTDKGHKVAQRAAAVWFVVTGICTAWTAVSGRNLAASAEARVRQIRQLHGRWAARHIASGIWVTLQRVLVLAGSALMRLRLLKLDSEEERVRYFLGVGGFSWLVCILAGEIHVFGRMKEKHS